MSAQPAKPVFAGELPKGLQSISNIIVVSSCEGGIVKSTVAVNLAYTLADMGARVGIFDADVYGPSLPAIVSPENRLLEMNPATRTILPTEYLGIKLASFGFACQGRAIMRGPMVSGVISQLLVLLNVFQLILCPKTVLYFLSGAKEIWKVSPDIHECILPDQKSRFCGPDSCTIQGELDYLVIDLPPGTGDIQLTLCQVPCVAVVENMCYFDADGKLYYPFGKGSGSQVVKLFGIPHLLDLPIRPTLIVMKSQ